MGEGRKVDGEERERGVERERCLESIGSEG